MTITITVSATPRLDELCKIYHQNALKMFFDILYPKSLSLEDEMKWKLKDVKSYYG